MLKINFSFFIEIQNFFNTKFDKLLCYLRYCHYCGRTYEFVDLFCESCWQELVLQIKPQTRVIHNIKVTSLFVWGEDDKLVELLVLGLKQGTLRPAYQRLLKIIFYHIPIDLHSAQIMIPSPQSSASSKPDHAFLLASLMTQQYHSQLCDILYKKTNLKQKWLNKKQRLELIVDIKEPFKNTKNCEKNSYFKASDHILFIDDVVTTGSTFYKSYIALQRPQNFEVFSLVYRPNLAVKE